MRYRITLDIDTDDAYTMVGDLEEATRWLVQELNLRYPAWWVDTEEEALGT